MNSLHRLFVALQRWKGNQKRPGRPYAQPGTQTSSQDTAIHLDFMEVLGQQQYRLRCLGALYCCICHVDMRALGSIHWRAPAEHAPGEHARTWQRALADTDKEPCLSLSAEC